MSRRAGIAGVFAALAILAACAPAAERAARAKLELLEDILRSKNDNDPRLDRDFNSLSPQAKRLFRRKYVELPREKRNERGTIVYLLGNDLSSPQDWAFLREVVDEPPCLNLADCSKKPESAEDEAAGDEVTLAYPALVALKQAQRALQASRQTPESSTEARTLLDAAKKSPTPAVARLALRIERQLKNSLALPRTTR